VALATHLQPMATLKSLSERLLQIREDCRIHQRQRRPPRWLQHVLRDDLQTLCGSQSHLEMFCLSF